MKVKLEEVNQAKKKVVVTLEPSEVKSSQNKMMVSLRSEVEVKGFRKGKAPDDMILREIGNDSFRGHLLRQLVTDTYPKAIEETKSMPISDPEAELETKILEGPVTYSATFEVVPVISAKDYKKIPLVKNEVSVEDEEVEYEISRLQRQMMQLEPAPDGAIDDDMIALVEYKGTADGKTFEGCESDNFVVETDNKSLLPDFIKGVRGMKAGEEKTIAFVYPKNYFNADVGGKKAKFEVKVKEVRKRILPEVNDDFTKNFGEFKSLKDFKAELKKRIETMKKMNEQARLERESAKAIADKNPFEMPPAMVSYHLNQMLEDHAKELSKQGKTLDDAKFDTNQFVRENYEEAMLRARWYVLAESIAEKEGLIASDKDVESRVKFLAEVNKKKVEEIMPKKGTPEWDTLCRSIRSSMALKFVIDNAKASVIKADSKKTSKPAKVSKPTKSAKKTDSKAKATKGKKGTKK